MNGAEPTAVKVFTQRVEVSAELACSSVEVAFALFLRVVWREGGGLGTTVIEEMGDLTTGQGCVRRVPGGVRERVIQSSPPTSLTYTVLSGAIFPVSAHEGCVTFATCDDHITVHWVCRYTPVFGFGWVLPTVICAAFRKSLGTLSTAAKTTSPPDQPHDNHSPTGSDSSTTSGASSSASTGAKSH